MLRAVIIDDEQIGVNALKVLIEKNTAGLKIVGMATSPQKGIELVEDYQPDVVFLDIKMPQMSGFDLMDRLAYKSFKLVLTTAHREYAIKAIKYGAHDYLLKPIDADELKTCVKNLMPGSSETKAAVAGHIIEIAVKNGIIFIKPEDIIRLEASGSYTIFHLMDNVKHVASKNLKEYEAHLDPDCFYRCHPSHIVNLKKVVRMISGDGLYAQMSDGSQPEIVRKNKDTFIEKLKTI